MSRAIGVIGVTGQVGRLLTEEIPKAGAALSGGTLGRDKSKSAPAGVALFDDVGALADRSDAMIDFTHAETIVPYAKQVRAHKAAWIVGASGLQKPQWDALRFAAETVPVVYAPNFAATAILMPELVQTLARLLPAADYDVEILETHHRHKVDAPSGTATAMGRLICETRGLDFDEVAVLGRDGETGARKPGAVGFGSIRAGEIVGETSIYFMSDDETVILGRRVFDRRVYAEGAVQAALWAIGRKPGLYAMKDVLAKSR
jgi:4-hydroxy-tetrahydrodipicolinate reductase